MYKSIVLTLIVASCVCWDTASAEDCTEADQIALEASGQLLPPPDLADRVVQDLKAIRSVDPNLKKVTHQAPWTPGQLIISKLPKRSLDSLNESKYGPVQAEPIFQDKIFLVKFSKAYHPTRLAEHLKKELNIEHAEPNGRYGGSSSITLTGDVAGINKYVFYQGSGDCPAGCINKRYITYTVTQSGDATLVSDKGSA